MTDLDVPVALVELHVGLRQGPAVLAVVPVVVPALRIRGTRVAEGLRLLGVDAVDQVEAVTAVPAAALAFGQLLDVEPLPGRSSARPGYPRTKAGRCRRTTAVVIGVVAHGEPAAVGDVVAAGRQVALAACKDRRSRSSSRTASSCRCPACTSHRRSRSTSRSRCRSSAAASRSRRSRDVAAAVARNHSAAAVELRRLRPRRRQSSSSAASSGFGGLSGGRSASSKYAAMRAGDSV